MPDYAKAEMQSSAAVDFRRGVGIASDGYAHVHVEKPTDATPTVYVVLPGGAMMQVNSDADELTTRKRADFIAAAINAKLSPFPPTPEAWQD